MARYTDAVCRQCRREGKKLFLKGERCYTDKCSVARRGYAPGQHGQARNRKPSEYGLQLRAKQTAKHYYGVLESQFAKYYEMATKKQGITGENLLQILESRLDNIVYRLGFAASRPMARQMVRHGYITVNGHRVNIPSYLCKVGDTVAVCDKMRAYDSFTAVAEANSSRPVPQWLSLDRNTMQATIAQLPARDEIDLEVEEQLIVELYSK